MFKRIVSVASAFVLLGNSTFLSAQDGAITLSPSSPWQVDYADKSCRLLRTFGNGESDTLLSITGSDPGGDLRIVIVSNRLRDNAVERSQIAMGPGTLPFEIRRPIGVKVADFGPGFAVILSQKSHDPFPFGKFDWSAIQWIQVTSEDSANLRLETSGLASPLLAFRKCIDDLARNWEIDLNAHWNKTKSTMPVEFYDVLSGVDIPKGIVDQSGELVSEFRLLIDETGKPSKCVSKPLGNPRQFDERVCAVLMAKSRFSPARDENGKPMKSYFNSAFRYRN
jgi:hypothetical protein